MKQNTEDAESAHRVLEHLAGAVRVHSECGHALRAMLLARVLSEIPPPGTRTVRAGSVAWMELSPGVAINLLRVDAATDNMTAYVRIEPGAVYAGHHHAQTEECLILEGEIYIGGHRLRAGDMHVARSGTDHAMITSPRGALMLLRCQRC